MRYTTNAYHYVKAVAFGCGVDCVWGACAEYTGGVPAGYTSLEDWYADEAEKLYRWKMVNGQLTLDADATPPDKDVPFAPADHYHYGLALGNCSNTDFNTLKSHGIYFGYTNMTNAAVQDICVLEVIPYSGDWVVQRQTVIPNTGAHITYERVFYNGYIWTEWGCVNPPMKLGREYRTMERREEKPVYAFLYNFGAVANMAEKYIPNAMPAGLNMVSIEAIVRGTHGYQINPNGHRAFDFIYYNKNSGDIAVKTNSAEDTSAYTDLHILFKYTK